MSSYSVENTYSNSISNKTFEELETFLISERKRLEDEQNLTPTIENMLYKPYQGLLYNIKHLYRWTDQDGEITILRRHNEIVGVSCVEYGDYHSNLGIGGIRCWIAPIERSKQVASKYLLHNNLTWCKNRSLAGMLLTFNDYNKWIYGTIRRASMKKSVSIAKVWSYWWNDCLIIDNPITIRYTPQWAVIKPIDIEVCKEIVRKINENDRIRQNNPYQK